MIKAGVLGLGKLGLPISVAMSTVHDVVGYDLNPNLNKIRAYEHLEQGFYQDTEFQEVFDRTSLKFANSLEELVNHSSLIFVAVQTPHEAHLDGSVRFTYSQAKDFDYTYLIKACKDLAPLVKPDQTVAIISTVLPGTITRHIVPILGKKCKLVYNPYFIAMGTVLRDFNDPEFILLGGKEEELRNILDFYSSYYDSWSGWCPPVKIMSYESAELTKVAYNTLISSKIVAINAVAEMAHGIQGCNVDDVSDALEASCKRLSSRRYMRGGLGDSGPCHVRDSISLSFLAERLGLSYNLYNELLWARELQACKIASLFKYHAGDLPKVILGKAFKEESNITTGSCALLIADILRHDGVTLAGHWDPLIDGDFPDGLNIQETPTAFLVATKHKMFNSLRFCRGSVVIDPFRYIKDQDGVKIIRFGVGK